MRELRLHNNAHKLISEATTKEIAASIEWYEKNIVEWSEKFQRQCPSDFHESLALLKLERGERLGRKQK